MMLLKTESTSGSETDLKLLSPVTDIAGFSAVIEWVQDSELRAALIAANVNILRREAPYVYFFANENGGTPGPPDDYVSMMETRELGRRVWLAPSAFEEGTMTTVTAVLLGDILPFVPCLMYESFYLLCLPKPMPLAEIDDTVTLSASATEAVRRLLTDGGCILSCVDHAVMTVVTFDAGYAKYFRRSKPDATA